MRTFKKLLEDINPVDMLIRDFVDNDVHSAYYEYFRHYHTYEEHIIPGLTLFDTIKGACKEPDLVELAWWYHDIIYIPGSPFSEEASADKAYFDCWQLGYGRKIASKVKELVLVTQHFKREPGHGDGGILHDMDLAVLASEPEVYTKYEQNIRKEYSFVDDKTFYSGRLEVLNHFLQKKNHLFATHLFQSQGYCKRAEENIRREIEEIKKNHARPE